MNHHDIIAEVCRVSGVTFDRIAGRERAPETIAAREAIYVLLRASGFGLDRIGRVTNKAHSSVHSAIARAQADPTRACWGIMDQVGKGDANGT